MEFVLFGFSFLFILIIYELFFVSKTKKRKEKDKKFVDPMEVRLLANLYRLDMKKVNYNQLLQIIALVSSFDIALIVTIVSNIKDFWLSIILGFIIIILVIMSSYFLIFLFYRKKGMIRNES